MVDDLVRPWQDHVEAEPRRIAGGERPYVVSDVLDREAAQVVAEAAGIADPAALALSARRLPRGRTRWTVSRGSPAGSR